MRVKCQAEEGHLFGNSGAAQGKVQKTNYNKGLKQGNTYIVYAVMQYKTEINYLIYDENEMASWHFADLFRIVDNSMPSNWRCNYLGYQPESLSFIVGYKEIAESINHYDGLLELEPKEIELFLKRKNEIDRDEAVKINKKGIIVNGDSVGWYIYLSDDTENSEGYTLFLSKSFEISDTDTNLDEWFETKEDIFKYFLSKKWEIEWIE